MKRLVAIILASMIVCGISSAFAERSVNASGAASYDYEMKSAYDEVFAMMGLPYGDFMAYLANPSFDKETFINSEFGELTALRGHIFMAYADNMDPELLEYYRAQGLEKAMFTGEDPANFNEQYYVYSPTDMVQGETYPVILVSHGGGANAHTTELYGWTEVAAKEKLILIATEDTSVEFLYRALNEVRSLYPVDNSRIYATGSSMGGIASRNLAAAYPNEVAAIAPMDNRWGFSDAEKAAYVDSGIIVPHIWVSGTADMYHTLPLSYNGPNEWNNMMDVIGSDEYKITYQEVNELIEKSLNIVEHYTGLRLPSVEVLNYVNCRDFVSRFVNEDGVNLLTVVCGENKIHMPIGHDVDIAWDFLQQFARNTETGELIVR